MPDEEIDFTDIPELTEEQFKRAKPFRQFLRERGIDYDAGAPATLVVYHEDGHSSTHQLAPVSNIIVLDDDVLRYFHDSETVNRTLRALIQLVPEPA